MLLYLFEWFPGVSIKQMFLLIDNLSPLNSYVVAKRSQLLKNFKMLTSHQASHADV